MGYGNLYGLVCWWFDHQRIQHVKNEANHVCDADHQGILQTNHRDDDHGGSEEHRYHSCFSAWVRRLKAFPHFVSVTACKKAHNAHHESEQILGNRHIEQQFLKTHLGPRNVRVYPCTLKNRPFWLIY